MTTETQKAYFRYSRKNQRKNINTARQPRRIKIIDEKCASEYWITRVDYEMYKAEYSRMKGIQVVIE